METNKENTENNTGANLFTHELRDVGTHAVIFMHGEEVSHSEIIEALNYRYNGAAELARVKQENEWMKEGLRISGDWGLMQENASLQIRIEDRNKALKNLLDALPRPDGYNSKLIAAMEEAHSLTKHKGG